MTRIGYEMGGLRPMRNEATNRMRNTMNRIFAIPAAVPAITPNPNIAAMIAMTRNVMLQDNISVDGCGLV